MNKTIFKLLIQSYQLLGFIFQSKSYGTFTPKLLLIKVTTDTLISSSLNWDVD